MGALETTPGTVRAIISDVIALWGLDDLAFAAGLIGSELATNAVHATTSPGGRVMYIGGKIPEIGVRLLTDGRVFRIEVWDQADGVPVMRNADPLEDESGRGLPLVDNLTAGRWGWGPADAASVFRKLVWAEITPEAAQ
jgi:anti-sigma regulatory factor (Ser/Thr protein kinase)